MFKALMGGGRSSSDTRSTSSSKSSSSRHRKTPSTVSRKSSRGDDRDRGLGDLAAYPSSDSRSKRASSTAGDSVASSYATAEPGNSIEPERIIIERTPRRRDTGEDNRRDQYPEGRDRDGKSARKREGEQTKSERDSRVGRDDAIDSADRDSGRLPERKRTQSGDKYTPPLSTSIPTPTTMPAQPGAPTVYDPHVQQQFPGQFPALVAEPYRPPNPAGEAADYYGDQGQSVSEQPGVRPKPPTVIPNSQAHLMPASPSVNPPPEPSSMGQVGAAAAYYADDADLDHQVQASQQPSKPSKPSSSSASKPPRPSIQTAGISGTTIAAAAGAVGAAAYGVASNLPQQTTSAPPSGTAAYGVGSSLPQQTTSAPSSGAVAYGVGSSPPQQTISAPPPMPVVTSTAPYAPPVVSSNNQPSHSHTVATAVGAAALGAAAGAMLNHHHQQSTSSADHVPQYTMQNHEESPQNGFGYPGPSMANPAFAAAGALPYAASPLHPHHAAVHHGAPFQSGSLAFQQHQRGPLDKFIDFWRDPEGVGKFEDYTETIGVCKYCFEPGTTSQDAPRNHHYDSRRLSADRYSNGSRVDKTSRYTSSEDEGRRRRKKSSRNSWLPGLLGGYAAKSLFSSKDFEDSYSLRSGRVVSSSGDNESVSTTRKSQTSRGVYRRRSRSRDDRDRSPYSESKRNRYEEARLRPSSRSPSRTVRNSGVKDAALGAVVASTALSVASSRHRSRSRSRSPKKSKSRKSSSSDFSLVDISTPGRKSVGGGITSFFTASSENRRKRRVKKRRSIFSLNNSSSSSLDADLAFGSGYAKKQTGKSKSRSKKKDRDVDAALLGLGAAATALAATSHRRSRRTGEILAAKDLRSHQSDYAPSATNDEGWEDFDSSSVSSALAFGSSALFGSEESQSSDSGTSKWGWRWGRKKDKKKNKKASSSENRFPTGAAVAAGALGGAALASAYQKNNRVASQGTVSSSGSLQHVSPIPLSDSARFEAQPALVRPGPIPLQQPQPMVPVSQALYATQGESIPAFSAPTEPPLSPLHDSEWYHRNPKWYEQIDVSPNVSREHHRSDSLPLFHTEPLEGTTVSSLKRRSTLKDQSVQFDLTDEQADKERRADRLQELKRDVEGGNGLQLIDRESQSAVQDSDQRSSRRYRERDYEKRNDDYNEVERYKRDSQKEQFDNFSWVAAAAAGTIGAAAAATVLSGKSSNDESSEVSQRRRDERREQRRAERRSVSKAESMVSIPSKSESAQDVVDARSSVDDHQPEHAKSSASRGVSRIRPVYDDYAQFFAPEELHRSPDIYIPEETSAASAPPIIEIIPKGESHPPEEEIPEYNHLPWPVPELKLIEPTPPHSISGSVRGAASPVVSPKEIHQEDVTPTERQTTGSRVSWGEHETHEYEAPSEHDSVDHDIPASADIGADIEFAATVAAATAAAGFNPSLVTDDPTYHTRTSPPGSEANVKFSERAVETRKDDGKEPKQFIEDQPLYSEPEIVSRGFESKEHSQDVLERLSGMGNSDEHVLGEAFEENEDSRGRSRESVSPPEDFFDVPSGFQTGEHSETSQRHDDPLRDGSQTVDSAPTSGEIETSARYTTSTEDDGDFEKIKRTTDDKEKEKKSGDFLRNIFGSRVSEPVESKRSSSADRQSSRQVQSEVGHHRSSRGDNDLSGYENDDSDKENGKVESKDGINIGDYKTSRQRKEERRRRRYEDIVESGKAVEHEKDPKISDNNHEDQSFLARRPEMPVNVGDGDNCGASGRSFAEVKVASQGFDVFDQQLSEKTVEPSSPAMTRGQENTDGQRPRRSSSVMRSRESPTAVPIHFRRPPTSPGVHRSSSAGSPATPSPAAPSPSSPTQERRRPTSTEFKNSREFRPLWLVERHGPGHGEDETDEPLPSLPSSKNSSANASTEDLRAFQDENNWEAVDLSHYVQDTRRPGDLDLPSSKGPEQEVRGSEQVTPTEVTFQHSRPHPPSRKDQLKYEFHSPSELLQDPIAYAELPSSLPTGDLPSAESSVVGMKDATVEESGIESIPNISRPSTPQNKEIPVSDADITPTQSKAISRANTSDVFKGPGFAGVVDAAVAAAVGTSVGIVPALDKEILAEPIVLVDDTQKDRLVSPIHSNGSIGFASVVDAAVAASADSFPNEKEELENIPSGLQSEQSKSVDEVPAVEESSRTDTVSADDSTPFDEGRRDSYATVIPVVEEEEVRYEPDKLKTDSPLLEETRESTEPAPDITDKGVDEIAQAQPTESTGSAKKKKKNKKKKKGQSIDLGDQVPKEDPEAAPPTSEETEKTREETTQEAPPAQPASIEQSSVPEESPTISQEPLLPTTEAEPALDAAEVSKALDSEPRLVSEAPEMPTETTTEAPTETPVETPADQLTSSKKSKRDKKKKRKSKGSAPEENEEEISTVEAVQPSTEIANEEQTPAGGQTESKEEDTLEETSKPSKETIAAMPEIEQSAAEPVLQDTLPSEELSAPSANIENEVEELRQPDNELGAEIAESTPAQEVLEATRDNQIVQESDTLVSGNDTLNPPLSAETNEMPPTADAEVTEEKSIEPHLADSKPEAEQQTEATQDPQIATNENEQTEVAKETAESNPSAGLGDQEVENANAESETPSLSRKNSKKKKKNKHKNTAEASIENEPSDNVQTPVSEGVCEAEPEPAVPPEGEIQTKQTEELIQNENKEEFKDLVNEDVPAPETVVLVDPAAESQPGTTEGAQEATPEENLEEQTTKKKGKKNKKNRKSSTASGLQAELEPEIKPDESASGAVAETPRLTQTGGEVASVEESQVPQEKITDDVSPELRDVASVPEPAENEPILSVEKSEANGSAPHVLEQPDVEIVPEPEAGEASSAGKKAKKNKKKKQSLSSAPGEMIAVEPLPSTDVANENADVPVAPEETSINTDQEPAKEDPIESSAPGGPAAETPDDEPTTDAAAPMTPAQKKKAKKEKKKKRQSESVDETPISDLIEKSTSDEVPSDKTVPPVEEPSDVQEVEKAEVAAPEETPMMTEPVQETTTESIPTNTDSVQEQPIDQAFIDVEDIAPTEEPFTADAEFHQEESKQETVAVQEDAEIEGRTKAETDPAEDIPEEESKDEIILDVDGVQDKAQSEEISPEVPENQEKDDAVPTAETISGESVQNDQTTTSKKKDKKKKKKRQSQSLEDDQSSPAKDEQIAETSSAPLIETVNTSEPEQIPAIPDNAKKSENIGAEETTQQAGPDENQDTQPIEEAQTATSKKKKKDKKKRKSVTFDIDEPTTPTTEPSEPTEPAVDLGDKFSQEVEQKLEEESSVQPSQAEEPQPEVLAPGDLTNEASATTEPELGDSTSTAEPPVQAAQAIQPVPELVTEAPADTLEESAASQQDQPTPEEKEPNNEAPIPEATDDTIISAPEVDQSEDKEIEPETAALPTPEDYENTEAEAAPENTEPELQAVDDAEQADGSSKAKDKKKKKKKKKTLELNEEAPAVFPAPVEETESDSDKFFDATEPEENPPAETAQEEEKSEEEYNGSMSAKAKKKAKKDKKRQSRNLDGTNDSQVTADSAANASEEGPQDLPIATEKAPGEFPQDMSESPSFSETESSVPSLETANAPAEEDGKENQSHDTELRGENDKDLTWTDEVYSQVEQQPTTSSDTSSQPVPKANPISAGEADNSVAIGTSVAAEETSLIVDEPEPSAEIRKLSDDGQPAEGSERQTADEFETAPTQEAGEAAGKVEASEEVKSRDDVEKMELDLTKEDAGEPLREEQAVDTVEGIEQMATEGPSNGAETAPDLPRLEETPVPESEETWAPTSSKKKKKGKKKKMQEMQAEEKKSGPSVDDMEENHVETQIIADTEISIAEENQKEGKTSEGDLEMEEPAAAVDLPVEAEAVEPALQPVQSSENALEQQDGMEKTPRELHPGVEPEGVAEEVNEVAAQSETLSRKESKKKKKKAKKQAQEEQEETFNPTPEKVEGNISADAIAAVREDPISPPADESNRSPDEKISDGQEAQEIHAEPSVSLDSFAVPLDTEKTDLDAEGQQDKERLEELTKDEDAQSKLRSQVLEKQDDLGIAEDLMEGQSIQPEATAPLSKKASKKEKRKSKKKSVQETVEPVEQSEPEALPESIRETHSIISPPNEDPEDTTTKQHVAVDLPEEQLQEPEVESQSLGTQQFGADEDAWPAIDWGKAKFDTKDQTPPHSSPEARAIPFEPAIIEFDVSAIPEGLTRRLSEDTLSIPSDKKPKKNKKNKRKSQSIETGEMLETLEETQEKKELINEDVEPTEPTTEMDMEPTPETASERIVQLTESLISSEKLKKELDMVLPSKGKVASIFPNLERGAFRRPASLQSLQSVKDSAEDETMVANRDSAIQVSEAPIAAGDSNHPPSPAMAQDDDKTRELVTTTTVRGPEEETKSIDIPWNDGNNNEAPLHAPLPVHGQSSAVISSSPMGIDEQRSKTPSSCELRRSPSVHGRHHHPPLTWSLENSSITKARTPSPPPSLFGGPVMNPDTASPPRTPLHTITEQEPEDRVERASRSMACERGTPRLEIKPEHVLPRPETPIRKFTDNALARLAWPTTDQDTLSDRDDEDINIGVKKRGQRGSEFPAGLHKTPEQGKPILMPSSGGSVQSNPNVSSTHRSLRRKTRNASGDLRTASQAHESHTPQPHDSQPPQPPQSDLNIERIASSSTYDPVTDKGKRPVRTMTDVYEGWGETPNSPRSPSRPPSVRHRRSIQHLQELESRLDQLVSENRLLIAAREAAENKLKNASLARRKSDHALNTRDADLRDREAEVEQLKSSVEWLQKEVARLTEENEGLATTNSNLTTAHATEIQTVRETSTRELGGLRSQYQQLSTEMQERVRQEVEAALAQKNLELRRLREELEAARDKVTQLQQQIAASMHDNALVFRDEDYFAAACQKLCGHVQQWVLRFSKHSDHRRCRKLGDLQDEKIADRFDNAILDGSDIDAYLTDRVRRRDVFMSVTMAMVWEFVFTRYLFGMDREQRQKLKSLEKQLGEIGPRSAVHRWRATTLTLLSKRPAFARQRESDTEAVALEIFETLSRLLPLPSHVEGQLLESLRKVLRVAVNLSVEMRTQLAEYIMLPPLQPEYDTNGDLARQVYFNASLMNERSGETTSNEELESQQAVVRIVLFPLVVKKGNDTGDGEDEVVVSPAQVLVARPDNRKGVSKMLSSDRMSLDATKSVHSMAPSSNMDISNVI